jgi:G3E family GTPase
MTTPDVPAGGERDEREPVPLTILTGFLGAGKTTLLNRILSSDHGLRIAVLVNDFGSVNIDADLVVGIENNMISLTNGCVCCEIRDDLLEAVDRLLLASETPDYIVLEASGVAEPMGIYATFAESTHSDRIRLDSVTCVVDADQIFDYIDRAPELLMLIVHQIGSADLVLLNKADLAGPERLAWLRAWVDEMMNRVRILETTYCDVPWDVLLSTDSSVARLIDASDHGNAHHEDHGDRFDRWTFESPEPISLPAIKEMVRRRLPGEIYRLKGFVYAAEDRDYRYVLHTVGRRSEISRHDRWGDLTPGTKLVAIGASGRLDEAWLRDALTECAAAPLHSSRP